MSTSIQSQNSLNNAIDRINQDITIIEEMPDIASDVFQIPEHRLRTLHNHLKVQASILSFQHFYHHKI